MWRALRQHWPEYLIEAGCLAIFMFAACTFAVIFGHPDSFVQMRLIGFTPSRLPMGIAMGLTAIALIYSSWGRRSGAHLNPSVTFTFWRLGKVAGTDACFYLFAQFAGGIGGVAVANVLLHPWLAHPAVNYAVTLPGRRGLTAAFVAELLISFILMSVVLLSSNNDGLSRYTGIFAGLLVATYITFEAPLSGMSMNPARTLGSAFSAHAWTALWIYFLAPPLGMMLAGELFVRLRGACAVICAKMNHNTDQRCIFRCGYAARAIAPH